MDAVKKAIKSPREIDGKLVDAQQARRILDRIVGYKISPLLWRKVRKGLSAGRVQSVAVKLICDREDEIDKFVSEEYWSITANLKKDDTNEIFQAKFYGTIKEKLKLPDKKSVDEVLKNLNKAEYLINDVKKKEKKRVPAPPFITSTLQQEASRKYGFTAKRTMSAAQQLYEGISVKGEGFIGLITYMRTDSVRVSEEALSSAREYISKKYGKDYLPPSPRRYKSKKAAQDAHEAIRPTNALLEPKMIKESLKPDQYKLYKLIWERFIASQMEAAVFDTMSVDILANDYLFKASGSNMKFPGFIVLYLEGKDEEQDEEGMLPDLEKGQKVINKNLEPKQHFTQPPSRYTEATLVKTLEEKGIGRPSTYAPIITTIISRGYVEREKKTLIPTELGIVVTDIMKDFFKDIVDIEFTVNMEDKLDQIEEGNMDWKELLKHFYSPFEKTLKEAENNMGKIEIKDEETDEICEKCGRNMVIKMGRYGKFLACPGFPECRNAKPIMKAIGIKCPKCGEEVYEKKSKKGKKYYGCGNNPKCDFMLWDEPVDEKCPKCGNMLVKKVTRQSQKIKCSEKECSYERNLKD